MTDILAAMASPALAEAMLMMLQVAKRNTATGTFSICTRGH